jgi:hypothetical protein
LLSSLTVALGNVVAQVPNPGSGKKPPGGDKLLDALSYGAWIALAICVLGVIVCGAMMAISHRHGSGGEHAARLGWVIAGCIVVGSASAIVQVFV